MGRKKKKVEKPWCWYCNREFDDDKVLIQHQKAKHFKCHICHKKLFSGPGLSIHCMQVHKETIDKIPGAVPGRDSVQMEIYGMQGIPVGSSRGDEEPSAKRERLDDMPPMPPGPMPAPPMIPGMPPFPPFPMMPGMPPMMPVGPRRDDSFQRMGAEDVEKEERKTDFSIGQDYNRATTEDYGHEFGRVLRERDAEEYERAVTGREDFAKDRASTTVRDYERGRDVSEFVRSEDFARGSTIRDEFGIDDYGRDPTNTGADGRIPVGDYGRKDTSSGYIRNGRDDYGAASSYVGYGDNGATQTGPPSGLPLSAVAVASKLGAKTRIIHPDDHLMSLEERRAMMMTNRSQSHSYH
uniref:BED-type domain-containing protein n=1 Tax=Heterorhabditis bacteriophora TaxID=37862 RepID=A0A1I7WMH7_HETBA